MNRPKSKTRKPHELTALAVKGCLIAKDAAYNISDLITNRSAIAALAVKDCEKELDQIERQIDEKLPQAITQVSEDIARELLACLKFITDLERIGDLLYYVAQRVQVLQGLHKKDTQPMAEMALVLQKMLEKVHEGFMARDLGMASDVLSMDSKLDQLRQSLFQRHLEQQRNGADVISILLIAQALERAGDHTKNLAEELFNLVQRHSLRHQPKRPRSES
jgi:phosphate transport system protein